MTFQVLILVQILIIRFCGVAVTHYDENFLYFGTTFAFSVIVSAIILNYVLGFNVSGLELIINTIGLVCFLAMGSVSLSNFDRFYGDNNKNKFKYYSHIKEIKYFFRVLSVPDRTRCVGHHNWTCVPRGSHLEN